MDGGDDILLHFNPGMSPASATPSGSESNLRVYRYCCSTDPQTHSNMAQRLHLHESINDGSVESVAKNTRSDSRTCSKILPKHGFGGSIFAGMENAPPRLDGHIEGHPGDREKIGRSAYSLLDDTSRDLTIEEPEADEIDDKPALIEHESRAGSLADTLGPEEPNVRALPLTPPHSPKLDFKTLPLYAKKPTEATDSCIGRRWRQVPPFQHSMTSPPSSTKLMDRFILPRRSTDESKTALIASTSPARLSKRERALRRRMLVSEVFNSPPRQRSTSATSFLHSSPRNGSRTRSNASGGSILAVRPASDLNTESSVLFNAMWTRGGSILAATYARDATPRARLPTQGRDSSTPIYPSRFLEELTPHEDLAMHEKRLALALGFDQAARCLGSFHTLSDECLQLSQTKKNSLDGSPSPIIWKDNSWARDGGAYRVKLPVKLKKAVPTIAFRVLEAPNLRDDYYCSILAYSHTVNKLAVGLGEKLYLWSEGCAVTTPPMPIDRYSYRPAYISSLSFSSSSGERAILAIGRGDGQITLWSPLDRPLNPRDPLERPRYLRVSQPSAAAHVSFRPNTIRRPSQRHSAFNADNEVLLVGDDAGIVWVYFVEWPLDCERKVINGWPGCVTLQTRISLHAQQVCGISWSLDGDFFATGGNDNMCCLVETDRIFGSDSDMPGWAVDHAQAWSAGSNSNTWSSNDPNVVADLGQEVIRHQWRLNAAVKAIAFCPWQRGLVAAGGGSNDRCIHFYHTMSGAALATIDCAAQVTSLTWSTTRREIAATFGFAQPEHPFRIAVYAWPSCQQVVAIPWHDEMRALYSISYPGGPNTGRRDTQEGGTWWSRTAEEGCIVVAASDGSIKFHEVWSEARRATHPRQGLLGGSRILESSQGIEREGIEKIR